MIVAASLVVACSAWEWKEWGKVNWDRDCDFTGYSFLDQASNANECPYHCYRNNLCTYFVHQNGICYLKSYGVGRTPDPSPGATCGYVPSRLTRNLK